MELKKVSSIYVGKRLDKSITIPVTCATFHTTENLLYFNFEDQIYISDISSGAIKFRLKMPNGTVQSILPSSSEPFLSVLILVNDDLYLYVWDTLYCNLRNMYPIRHLSAKKPYFIQSSSHESKIMFSQHGQKTIHILDIRDGSIKKIETPKNIYSMKHHPIKPFLAVVIDGSIKIYNTLTLNVVTTYVEIGGIESILGSTKEKKEVPLICFHPNYPYLVVSVGNGYIMCWDELSKVPYLGHYRVTNYDYDIISMISFHPTLPIFTVGTTKGVLSSWYFSPTKGRFISKLTDPIGSYEVQATQYIMQEYNEYIPKYLKFNTEVITTLEIIVHPFHNYFFFLIKCTSDELSPSRFQNFHSTVFSLYLREFDLVNMVFPLQKNLIFWTHPHQDSKERSTFYFSNECHYLDDSKIMAYSPAYDDTSLAKQLPTVDYEQNLLKVVRIIKGWNRDRFLVFYIKRAINSDETSFTFSVVTQDMKSSEIPMYSTRGFNGVFLGDEDEILILSANGLNVEIWSVNQTCVSEKSILKLQIPIGDVYWTPLNYCSTVLMVDFQKWRVYLSAKANYPSRMFFAINTETYLQLEKNEMIMQVQWQRDAESRNSIWAAILTSKRILIINEKLQIIKQLSESALSILWVGPTIFFTTRSQLKFFTFTGFCSSIISIFLDEKVISTVLCDRVVLITREGGQVNVATQALGLFEPLALGFLDYFETYPEYYDRKGRNDILKRLMNFFDTRRISEKLISAFLRFGYQELVLKLFLINPKICSKYPRKAYELSLENNRLDLALDFLDKIETDVITALTNGIAFSQNKGGTQAVSEINDVFVPTELNQLKSTNILMKDINSYIVDKLINLAELAMKYGKFDLARKCYESLKDYPNLIYLSLLTKSRKSLEITLQMVQCDTVNQDRLAVLIKKLLEKPEFQLQEGKDENLSEIVPESSKSSTTRSNNKNIIDSITSGKICVGNSLSSANFNYCKVIKYENADILKNSPLLFQNPPYSDENKNGKISCMRTLPLESGSGNLVIGAVLLNKLLADWFPHQVPFFDLPNISYEQSEEIHNKFDPKGNSNTLKNTSKTIRVTSQGFPEYFNKIKKAGANIDEAMQSQHAGMKISSYKGYKTISKTRVFTKVSNDQFEGNLTNDTSINSSDSQKYFFTSRKAPDLNDKFISYIPNKSIKTHFRAETHSDTSGPNTLFNNMNSYSSWWVDAVDPLERTEKGSLLSFKNAPCAESDPIYDDMNWDCEETDPDSNFSSKMYCLTENSTNLPAWTHFKIALSRLDHLEYNHCILSLDNALIRIILNYMGSDKKMELLPRIKFCVNYKLLCTILINLPKLESMGNEILISHLLQIISGFKFSLKHSLIIYRMAIKKALEVSNFRTASNLLQVLTSKKLPDLERLEELKKTFDGSKADENPLSESTTLCYITLTLIEASQHRVVCIICGATYKTNQIRLSQICPFCLHKRSLRYADPVKEGE